MFRSHTIRLTPGRRQVLAGAWLLAAWGCGGDATRVPLYPASGRVMVDGAPARGVEVRLVPGNNLSSLDALRPFAVTGEDGSFVLGTYDKDDGAPEGQYKAILFWPDKPPGLERPNDRLGGAYTKPERSTFDANITKGENRLPPFEAKSAPAAPKRAPANKKTRSAKPD